jgi:hypothetical protein
MSSVRAAERTSSRERRSPSSRVRQCVLTALGRFCRTVPRLAISRTRRISYGPSARGYRLRAAGGVRSVGVQEHGSERKRLRRWETGPDPSGAEEGARVELEPPRRAYPFAYCA